MNKDYKLNVSEIFASLCRHLSASSDIKGVSTEFMLLDSYREMVDYAHEMLMKYGLLQEYDIGHWKDDALSAKFRESGNEMFKNKRQEYAVELYTKSIAYADANGELLGLAYGNRSAALFEQNMFRECLEDVDRALGCWYPEKIRDKLIQRKARAEDLIEMQGELPTHCELPLLSHEPNPYIACAANCVSIKNSPEMGRHVIATKDIQIGDVIAIEKPFAKIVLPDASITHCHNCLRVCFNLVSCSKCSYALFCSTKCLAESADYHKYECPVTGILLSLQVSKLNLLALRVTILAKKDKISRDRYGDTKDVYESERYNEIHNLCSNFESRTNADKFERALVASIIFEIVRKYTVYFTDFPGRDSENMFKDLLFHHLLVAPSNFHEISELMAYESKASECLEIGAGAYSFLSLLNHSCAPNVLRNCYKTTIVLRALSPIKKGQQLFDNYGYHYAVMPKYERLKHLENQYRFICTCEACSNDWPLYENLSVLNFEFEVSEEEMEDLKQGNLEVANRILKSLLIKAAILEKMRPCKNLANIQECIKQCYSILGNKKFPCFINNVF